MGLWQVMQLLTRIGATSRENDVAASAFGASAVSVVSIAGRFDFALVFGVF
jgi:hypothetical protein